MWYFSWILGLGLAVCFGVLNAMWHELHVTDADLNTVPNRTRRP